MLYKCFSFLRIILHCFVYIIHYFRFFIYLRWFCNSVSRKRDKNTGLIKEIKTLPRKRKQNIMDYILAVLYQNNKWFAKSSLWSTLPTRKLYTKYIYWTLNTPFWNGVWIGLESNVINFDLKCQNNFRNKDIKVKHRNWSH